MKSLRVKIRIRSNYSRFSGEWNFRSHDIPLQKCVWTTSIKTANVTHCHGIRCHIINLTLWMRQLSGFEQILDTALSKHSHTFKETYTLLDMQVFNCKLPWKPFENEEAGKRRHKPALRKAVTNIFNGINKNTVTNFYKKIPKVKSISRHEKNYFLWRIDIFRRFKELGFRQKSISEKKVLIEKPEFFLAF